MRLRLRVGALMGVVALLAGLMGMAAGIHRRAESFKRLAAYHDQASCVLIDQAGGPLPCGTGLTESDIAEIFCNRGPSECRACRASQYHWELAQKYRCAAKRSWLPVSDDPPPPPCAFLDFKVDPLYYDLVDDGDLNTGLG